MDQELTVSKSLVDYLYNNLPAYKVNNAQKCVDIVEQNYFVSDKQKDHLKKFYDELDQFPESDKRKNIFELIDHIIRNNLKCYDHIYSVNDECEILLSGKTEDKILFDASMSLKEVKKKTIRHADIEFLNDDLLINPETSNRFKVIPITKELEVGVRFDLNNFLKPFLRNAKEINLIDPFLANKNAFNNFKNLFEIIEKNCNIKLKLYSERDYLSYANNKKEEFKENYELLMKEIRIQKASGYKINIEEFKIRKHKERYIITDKFEITVPGGLDCLDEDGIPLLDSDNEKKRFTVSFITV